MGVRDAHRVDWSGLGVTMCHGCDTFKHYQEMPVQMVGLLLDILFQPQNIYLIDLYCFQKVLPKVQFPLAVTL